MALLPPLAPPPSDGTPVYPVSFPVPDREPYGMSVDMGVIRSEFSAGNSRQRRAYRVMPHAFRLTFRLRTAELYLWQNWSNAHAFAWFYCPLASMYAGGPPDPETLRYELIRFAGDLDITAAGHDLFLVTVPAELSPTAAALDPGYGTGIWVIAGTPAAPSGGWIIAGAPGAPSLDTLTAGTPGLPATL